jgi:hypothetical protein
VNARFTDIEVLVRSFNTHLDLLLFSYSTNVILENFVSPDIEDRVRLVGYWEFSRSATSDIFGGVFKPAFFLIVSF